jgi:hypothetical protein
MCFELCVDVTILFLFSNQPGREKNKRVKGAATAKRGGPDRTGVARVQMPHSEVVASHYMLLTFIHRVMRESWTLDIAVDCDLLTGLLLRAAV